MVPRVPHTDIYIDTYMRRQVALQNGGVDGVRGGRYMFDVAFDPLSPQRA